MLRRSVKSLVTLTFSPVGTAHPDVAWGNFQTSYRGPGWCGWHKLMPTEAMMVQGGSTLTSASDRVGQIIDPEDPRHPIATYFGAGHTHHEGTTMKLTEGNTFNPVPESSRFLQVLYDAYLEPFSMHRPCGILDDYEYCPNHVPDHFAPTLCYLGQTASIVGRVLACWNSSIGENVSIRADVNDVYIQEGAHIMDNTCIAVDRPTNPQYYQREEDLNPYQKYAPMEGAVVIRQHTVIEPNCYIDSCMIGAFAHIGHGTHIMKGVTIGDLAHVMPGSVVAANTKIGDEELWGGAPARKLGKVATMETKRVFGRSNLIKDFLKAANNGVSQFGDQQGQRLLKNQALDHLLVVYEEDVSPAVRAKIEAFVEGREPWHHKITRMTQGWMPPTRGDDRGMLMAPPLGQLHQYAKHNDDSFDSKLHGTGLNLTNYMAEFSWL